VGAITPISAIVAGATAGMARPSARLVMRAGYMRFIVAIQHESGPDVAL
jgi:hypothetical protein